MSTVVYRTQCAEWTPENSKKEFPAFDSLDKVYHTLNPQENTLVIVTTRRVSVEWARLTRSTTGIGSYTFCIGIAPEACCSFTIPATPVSSRILQRQLPGTSRADTRPKIFRCLAGINRLRLQNVGLLEQLGRLIRYTMRAGSDVEPALSEAQKQKAIKANLFGQGFEDGHRQHGCSYKGRIWSYRTANSSP